MSTALYDAWIDFKAMNSKTDGGPALMSSKQRAKRKARRRIAKLSRRRNRA